MDRKLLICNKNEDPDHQIITASELEAATVEIIENDQELDEDDVGDMEPKTHSSNSGIQTMFAKFMEEKCSITYRKLVVPQSMRSIYWKFFGFPADDDGEILTRLKIVCLICRTQIAYNRNTSNLRMHLQNKHSQELRELEAASPPRKQIITPESKEKRAQKRLLKAAMANSGQHIYTTNADGTVQIGGDIQFVTDPSVSFDENCGAEEEGSAAKPVKFIVKNVNTSDSNRNVAFVLSEELQQEQQQQQQLSTATNKTITDAILEYVIIDLQLPQVVQEQGFQRLIATLKSPCQIPSRNSLEEDIIPKTYDNFRDTIVGNISSLTSEISLAVEEWTSNIGENFFTFLIYYQNIGEASLESKILCTMHAPNEWTEQQWGIILDTVLNDWCVKIEKITAVVLATNRSEFVNAVLSRGLSVVPCLLHSLQVCAQAIFDDYRVAKVLAHCRAAIGAISSQPDAAAGLAMQEQLLGVRTNFVHL